MSACDSTYPRVIALGNSSPTSTMAPRTNAHAARPVEDSASLRFITPLPAATTAIAAIQHSAAAAVRCAKTSARKATTATYPSVTNAARNTQRDDRPSGVAVSRHINTIAASHSADRRSHVPNDVRASPSSPPVRIAARSTKIPCGGPPPVCVTADRMRTTIGSSSLGLSIGNASALMPGSSVT